MVLLRVSWGVKGVGFSLLLSLGLCFLFGLFLRFVSLDYGGILTGVCLIKSLSILFGCATSVKESKGWAKGLFIGGMTIVFSRFIFLLIPGLSFFGSYLFYDLLFGLIVGFLSGIIAVHVRK